MSNSRIFYMDALRGILMMLGLVYHSAKTFSTQQDWIIFSTHTTIIADILVQIIHIFRMPTFFIISGYFAAMTLHRYGIRKFLKLRIVRIIVPLLTTALVINSFQAYILTETGWINFHLESYLLHGHWVTHLWFLFNLIIYFLFYALLAALFHEKLDRLILSIDSFLQSVPFAFILFFILPLLVIFCMAVGQLHPIRGIINTSLIFEYLPFFFFGIFLRYNKNLLKKFSEYSPMKSFVMTLAAVIIGYNLQHFDTLIWTVIKTYILGVGMWFSSSLCFYLFKKFTNFYSRIFKFLADISYTVYLFHQVFVIGIGIILIQYDIGGMWGLSLQIVSATVLAVSVHVFIISKYNILSILFNGKKI